MVQAALVYDRAALELDGSSAKCNFSDEGVRAKLEALDRAGEDLLQLDGEDTVRQLKEGHCPLLDRLVEGLQLQAPGHTEAERQPHMESLQQRPWVSQQPAAGSAEPEWSQLEQLPLRQGWLQQSAADSAEPEWSQQRPWVWQQSAAGSAEPEWSQLEQLPLRQGWLQRSAADSAEPEPGASAPAAAMRCIKVPAGEPAPAGYRLATTAEARAVPGLAACLEAWDIARLADGWVDGYGYGSQVGSGWRDGLGHKVVIADPSMQQRLPQGPYVIRAVQGGSKGQVQLSSAGARHGQQLQHGAPGVLSKHLRSDGSRALEAEVWADGDEGGCCQEWSVAAKLLTSQGLCLLPGCLYSCLPAAMAAMAWLSAHALLRPVGLELLCHGHATAAGSWRPGTLEATWCTASAPGAAAPGRSAAATSGVLHLSRH
jgi:hypothetical protein